MSVVDALALLRAAGWQTVIETGEAHQMRHPQTGQTLTIVGDARGILSADASARIQAVCVATDDVPVRLTP